MSKIDTAGTYIGEVLEMGVSLTQKNKYPQAIVRLKATKKWVGDTETMAHFKITEPGYVPWAFEGQEPEDIIGYLVLFKSADDLSDDTKLLNYEQLQLALGWDGSSFDSLADGTYVGKSILFRVEENNYEGKVSLQVNWVDSETAAPERSLKSLDAGALTGLNKLLKTSRPKTPAAPAKPAAAAKPAGKPGAAGAAKPGTSSSASPVGGTIAPVNTATTASVPISSTKTTSPSKAPAKAPAPKPAPAPAPAEAEAVALPAAVSKETAWEYVTTHKGENEDTTVEDAWMAATQEVGPDRNETDFNETDWAKVRDIIIKDLDLK